MVQQDIRLLQHRCLLANGVNEDLCIRQQVLFMGSWNCLRQEAGVVRGGAGESDPMLRRKPAHKIT
jgi:hypothetical protein